MAVTKSKTTAVTIATDLTLYGVNPTGKEIGRGAYGRVFEVDYHGTLCAAKEVHALLLHYSQDEEHQKIRADFLNECEIWSTIRHPCVVQFLGVYYPERDQYKLPVMVMEKMLYSLRALVEKFTTIPFSVKISILDEVCLGLQYLHSRSPPIVHRDLTPNNILLGGHLEAKITDLGVAKIIQADSKMTMTKIPGTPDFMPPEALTKRPLYGPPLDIFSFGGVSLNVISQQWPEPTDREQLNPDTDQWIVVSEANRREKFLKMFTDDSTDLIPLVKSCLNDNPKKRPSAIQVSVEIKRVKESCSKQSGCDAISPIEWLAEISGHPSSGQQVASLKSQLGKTKNSNEQLRGEIDALKNEISGLKKENAKHALKNKCLDEEVNNLKKKYNLLQMEIGSLMIENKELKVGSTQLEAEIQKLKASKNKEIPPPIPPRTKGPPPIPPRAKGLTTRGTKQLKKQIMPNELFSESMNIKWIEGAHAPIKCGYHSAVLYEGKVYIGGGYDNKIGELLGASSFRVDTYDPVDNSWSPFPIKTPYCHFSMTLLNNRLILVGGRDKGYKVTNKIFSLRGSQLKEYTKMTTPRYSAAAAGHQAMLIIAGGKVDKHIRLATTELFDSVYGQWFTTDNLPQLYAEQQPIIINNTLYLVGGSSQDCEVSSEVLYASLDTLSSHSLKWSHHKDLPWRCSTPVSLQNRHLVTVGGCIKGGIGKNEIYILNMITQKWKLIGQIPSAREAPSLVSIDDSKKIIVIGGFNKLYNGYCMDWFL